MRVCTVYRLVPWVFVCAASAEHIVLDPAVVDVQQNGSMAVQFLLEDNTVPLLGYSLDVEVTPMPGATGAVTIDVEQSNLSFRRNVIAAGGGTLNSQLSTIIDLGGGSALVNAVVDNGVPVVAIDGINDVLAEVVFNASDDASGSFAIALGNATALSDAGGFAVSFTSGAGLINVSGCETFAECADTDGNGVRDDGCVWWACDGGTCLGTDVPFADMGGAFGGCTADGTADGNDRFHALNCFANTDPNDPPPAGYPCEPHPAYPPQAFNVDAGGAFGSCSPDGVCDGNDAFAALNAFGNTTLCSCPLDGGPAPDVQPVVIDRGRMTLKAKSAFVHPGDVVEVDVFLDQPVEDLRGYQLHVMTRGGQGGQLQLTDMRVDVHRPGFALEHQAVWTAFNLASRQLIVGMDTAGIRSSSTGYLATLTLRASPDAAGRFAIDILHDSKDPGHRTFLFPTPAHGLIEVVHVSAAVIHVSGGRTRSSN